LFGGKKIWRGEVQNQRPEGETSGSVRKTFFRPEAVPFPWHAGTEGEVLTDKKKLAPGEGTVKSKVG